MRTATLYLLISAACMIYVPAAHSEQSSEKLFSQLTNPVGVSDGQKEGAAEPTKKGLNELTIEDAWACFPYLDNWPRGDFPTFSFHDELVNSNILTPHCLLPRVLLGRSDLARVSGEREETQRALSRLLASEYKNIDGVRRFDREISTRIDEYEKNVRNEMDKEAKSFFPLKEKIRRLSETLREIDRWKLRNRSSRVLVDIENEQRRAAEIETQLAATEQWENAVKMEKVNRAALLKSGKVKVANIEDALLLENASDLNSLMSGPKIRADGITYSGVVITEAQEDNGIIRAVDPDNRVRYTFLRMTAKTVVFGPELRMNGVYLIIGKYKDNVTYSTLGGKQQAPLIEVTHIQRFN